MELRLTYGSQDADTQAAHKPVKSALTKVDSFVAWLVFCDSPRIFEITLLASKAVMAVFTPMLTSYNTCNS